MSSLIERLCKKQMRVHDLSGVGYVDDPDCIEAAARIAALEAQLAERVKVKPLDNATQQKLREALRFAASRSVLSSEDERRILSALEATLPTSKVQTLTIPCSVPSDELLQWAEKRADDAGRLARELILYRRMHESQGTIPEGDDETCTCCHGTGWYGSMERYCDCEDGQEVKPPPAPKVTEEDVARRIFNDAHAGMRNCYDWDTAGLEDEHPGTMERYRGYARSAIQALTAAQEAGK